MLIKVLRSQKTVIGQLRAGVAYDFDEGNEDHMKVAQNLLDRKPPFGEKTTVAKIKKDKVKAEKLSAASDVGKAEAKRAEEANAEKLAELTTAGQAADNEAEAAQEAADSEKDATKKVELQKLADIAKEKLDAISAEYLGAGGK